MLKVTLTCLLGAVPGLAMADLKSDALRVLEHRLAMPIPKTVFDKWQADQWTFAAAGCGVNAGLSKAELVALNKLPIYGAGSHSSPKDEALTCETLARAGPSADCFNMRTTLPPFTSATEGLSSDYIFLPALALATEGSTHGVAGYCNLVKHAPHTRQMFAGPAVFKWLLLPRIQSFMTGGGERSVKAGTVTFTVQGMPGQASPQTVIVAN